MRIVVAGAVAAAPGQGGAAWAVLQYAIGFRRLGHEVLVVEEAADRAGVETFFDDVMGQHDLRDNSVMVTRDGAVNRLGARAVREWFASADLLVNLGGVLRNRDLLAAARRSVYVDVDPGFTQCWQHADGIDMNFGGHDVFVTVGLAVGELSCPIPTCGLAWHHTVPPVVLAHWAVDNEPPTFGVTTVGNWRSYGSTTYRGVEYGQKVHTVRSLIGLPELVPEVALEPALAIHDRETNDWSALTAAGWRVRDPRVVARDPETYRTFIRSSVAELGLVKSGYVASRSGWFSDRSACYLACGRPAIVEDTGWTRFLPSGEGLLSFTDADSAAAAIREVVGNYDRHRKAARAVAEECFDSNTVLPRLLDTAELS